MIVYRKKEASPCSLDGAVSASFKLDQNYYLTQFDLHTRVNCFQTESLSAHYFACVLLIFI
jgi:hypothetical protein